MRRILLHIFSSINVMYSDNFFIWQVLSYYIVVHIDYTNIGRHISIHTDRVRVFRWYVTIGLPTYAYLPTISEMWLPSVETWLPSIFRNNILITVDLTK